MSDTQNDQKKINVHMPETNDKALKTLFIMLVVFSGLLITFFVMDKGREETVQKFEALRDGIVATMPLQHYLTQYRSENQTWPQENAALQAVGVQLPESVKTLVVEADGTVTLTYTDAVHDGGKVHLKPQVEEGGRVRWLCLGENLPEDILPQECSLLTP